MNLKDYIRGQRQGKEANQLERKAMEDPFLQDAIDGYDSVEGDHISAIEELEHSISSKKRTRRPVWIWVAAAVVVLLIGIPLLLNPPYPPEEITVASTESIVPKEEVETPLLKEDSLLVADHHRPLEKQDPEPQLALSPPPVAVETMPRETIEELVAEDIKIEEEEEFRSDIVKSTSVRELGIAALQTDRAESIYAGGVPESSPRSNTLFVSGRMVDETGAPIQGVTIHLPNTHAGTVSDSLGNFGLLVPKKEKEKLVASYIGMHSAEIPLKENVGDIMMKSDDMALNEVVVVGYGTRKKRSFAGSVSAVEDTITFGEEEFKEYFAEHYDKSTCADQKITFEVEFFIDPIGRPAQVKLIENACPELETEIRRLLLGSPSWSKTNRKVTLRIELH